MTTIASVNQKTKEAWAEFINSLSPDGDESVLKQIRCPLLEFFDEQKYVDQARKDLFKKELNLVLKLYLSRIDLKTLVAKMKEHENNFLRGFGQDKLNHLKFLCSLLIILDESRPKRGLLAS